MLFQIVNGAVSFGAETVLEKIDFEINAKQKIALVGRNGSGKSTLLKAICGLIDMEQGSGEESFAVHCPVKNKIGYLKQMSFEDESISMGEEILKAYRPILEMESAKNALSLLLETDHSEENIMRFSELEESFELAGGYYYKKEYDAAIKSFGFSEQDKAKPISHFSGGQRTKIAFLRLLLEKPDILLLDEPTNHLDLKAVLWLEEYLKSYKNSVVIVSHDRMFLDKVVDTVYEIEYGATNKYTGNYSEFVLQKQQNYQKNLKDYEAQQKEIARLMRIVERFKNKPTKVAMTRSKLKQIEHMVKIDAPDRYDLSTFHSNCQPLEDSVKNVMFADELKIGYSPDVELAKISFEVQRGDKIGIIGGNGLGKSTLIKTLVGKLPALSGEVRFGVRVSIGYFDQQMALYSSPDTVFEDFSRVFPKLKDSEVRSALGAFQFRGDDVFKTVDMLSGGERVRLALCKIFMCRPNLLIFDEPTNHMDIVGKETLERMLSEYTGTIIFVSHDRYFVNRLATKLIVFEQNSARFLPYTYEEYIEKFKSENFKNDNEKLNTPTKPKKPISTGKMIRERNKEEQRRKNKKAKLEREIEELEQMISSIDEQMTNDDVISDYEALKELSDKKGDFEFKLISKMEEWDKL